MKFFKKFLCLHKWKLEANTLTEITGFNNEVIQTYYIRNYMCIKCGKFKKITTK